jgi:cytochrome c oxidase subunit 1
MPFSPATLTVDAPLIVVGMITRPKPSDSRIARAWFLLAIGSLLLAGLLSLLLVLGRLPFLSPLFTDPLFFKRALVVHVNLAMVIWFQAGTAAFLGLALGAQLPRRLVSLSLVLGVVGVLGLLAGAVMPGAHPILANYIPVIDHPVFIGGLICWFAGTGLFFATTLFTPANAPNALSDDTLVALRASAAANLIAIATLCVAWRTTLSGLPAIGYYELIAWGGGHVLQVANVAATLGLWLFLLHRWSGKTVLTSSAVRWLLAALVLPTLYVPLLALGGTSSTAYNQGSTQLMRWTIFPVALIVLGLSVRHIIRHRASSPLLIRDHRINGFVGSATLTVLGFVLGSLIRSSTTLVPGHYHAAIGAVTLALMAAAYEFCRTVSPAALIEPALRRARLQLLLFGGGQAVFALGFALAGAYGLGRKQYASDQHVRSLGEYLGLGVMGAGGLVAVASGLLFLAVMVRCINTWRHRSPQLAYPL